MKTLKELRMRRLFNGLSNMKESVELDEATDFRPGDTVHEVGSKLKGTVQHKGNRDLIAVKFGSVNQMIPASRLRLVESVELGEAMGPLSPQQIAKLKKEYGSIDKINVTGPAYKKVKAMIKNMDKEDLMTLAKAKVKWLSGFAASELRLTHNMKIKPAEYMESVELDEALPPHLQKLLDKNGNLDPKIVAKLVKSRGRNKVTDVTPKGYGPKESVELGEAKISVGDRVTLQPNKNTPDRSLIGKAGVVTGMLGSKPTVKFANGQTIVVSPKDLKINESVEVDEAAPKLKGNSGPWSKADLAKAMKIAKVDIAVATRITKALRESFELDEAKNYEYKDGKVHISKANFRKVHNDYKNPTKGKERMVVLDPKTQGTVSAPVVFTEESFELGEAKNYEYKDGKVHISKANFRKVSRDYKNPTKGKERMVVLDPKTQGTVSAPVVFTEESFELDESKSKKYYNDLMKSALKKAGRKMDPDLTSSFATNGDFIVSDRGVVVARLKKGTYPTMKESIEHENCGTPDCCGTCDTDIKEMNFFQFRSRLDRTRD